MGKQTPYKENEETVEKFLARLRHCVITFIQVVGLWYVQIW